MSRVSNATSVLPRRIGTNLSEQSPLLLNNEPNSPARIRQRDNPISDEESIISETEPLIQRQAPPTEEDSEGVTKPSSIKAFFHHLYTIFLDDSDPSSNSYLTFIPGTLIR